jgi:hypothetical protein
MTRLTKPTFDRVETDTRVTPQLWHCLFCQTHEGRRPNLVAVTQECRRCVRCHRLYWVAMPGADGQVEG